MQDSQPLHEATPSQSVADIDSTLEISPAFNTESLSQAYVVIDKAKQDSLRAKLEETINNPRFWSKVSRYDSLMSAMSVPVFDDRSLHQYYIHSESDLKADAATKSFATGVPAVLPTEEEIKAEAWRRWVADNTKEVTKSLNKQRREDAKKAGIKFVPVPVAEVQAIVAKAETELRASEGC